MRFALAVVLTCLGLPAFAHDGVHVTDAYAIVVSPNAPTAAVYFTVVNHAIVDDRLIAATTDAAQMSMLHESVETDGVMSMGDVAGFVVEGQGSFTLARGGAHVMLMALTKPLNDGDTISVTLTFERSGEVVVEVPVNPAVIPGE
jgi:periplasmic copper chaperone A